MTVIHVQSWEDITLQVTSFSNGGCVAAVGSEHRVSRIRSGRGRRSVDFSRLISLLLYLSLALSLILYRRFPLPLEKGLDFLPYSCPCWSLCSCFCTRFRIYCFRNSCSTSIFENPDQVPDSFLSDFFKIDLQRLLLLLEVLLQLLLLYWGPTPTSLLPLIHSSVPSLSKLLLGLTWPPSSIHQVWLFPLILLFLLELILLFLLWQQSSFAIRYLVTVSLVHQYLLWEM